MIGRTDLDVAISNQCGRLIANVVTAYNSILLSMLLDRYQAAGNQKALELLKKISPVAWQHIHFLGHYAFRNNHNPIDVEAMLANIKLVIERRWGNSEGLGLQPRLGKLVQPRSICNSEEEIKSK